jgi:hypothetical protein
LYEIRVFILYDLCNFSLLIPCHENNCDNNKIIDKKNPHHGGYLGVDWYLMPIYTGLPWRNSRITGYILYFKKESAITIKSQMPATAPPNIKTPSAILLILPCNSYPGFAFTLLCITNLQQYEILSILIT